MIWSRAAVDGEVTWGSCGWYLSRNWVWSVLTLFVLGRVVPAVRPWFFWGPSDDTDEDISGSICIKYQRTVDTNRGKTKTGEA